MSDSYGNQESRNPTSGADYDEISLVIGCLRSRDFLEQLTVIAVSAQLCRLHGIFHCIVVTQDSTDVCSYLKICFILVQNSTMVNYYVLSIYINQTRVCFIYNKIKLHIILLFKTIPRVIHNTLLVYLQDHQFITKTHDYKQIISHQSQTTLFREI